MKRTYIQPSASDYSSEVTLDFMQTIPVSGGTVEDGFAKDRDDFSDEDIEAIVNQKDGWKGGLW